MRVLHLIDERSSQACGPTVALLAESVGRIAAVEDRVLGLGGQYLRGVMDAVGLSGATVAGVPLGSAVAGFFSLRRALRGVGPVDLVHCWGLSSFTAATMLMGDTPRLLTLTQAPPPRSVHWLRTVASLAAGPSVVLPISATIRRAVLSGGVAEEAVHVLRPGLDLGRVTHGARAALRERWGLDPAANVRVVALLADPPTRLDAAWASLAVSLGFEPFDPRQNPRAPVLRLLVHPDQQGLASAQHTLRLAGYDERFIIDDALDRPWDVLPGCDAAVAMGDAAGGLSLLWAMAANVPIVGEATYAVSEVVEDRHSALLAKPDHLQQFAHRVTTIVEDTQLAWKLRDTARHEAYSLFSRQRYCQSLATVYEQVLDRRAVDVPALPITGGLRFTGRA